MCHFSVHVTQISNIFPIFVVEFYKPNIYNYEDIRENLCSKAA